MFVDGLIASLLFGPTDSWYHTRTNYRKKKKKVLSSALKFPFLIAFWQLNRTTAEQAPSNIVLSRNKVFAASDP